MGNIPVNQPDSSAIPILFFLLLFIPAVAVFSWLKLRSGLLLPPKMKRYKAMVGLQILVLFSAIMAARHNRIPLLAVGNISIWLWLGASIYLVFVAFRIITTWPRLSDERREKTRRLLPENQPEMKYWIRIAILAGLCEEYAYRGVAYSVLLAMTHSLPVALIVCVSAFGLAHLPNGWQAALQSALLALIFHLLVILTQTLLLVISFHIAYDLVIGIFGMHVLRRNSASLGNNSASLQEEKLG